MENFRHKESRRSGVRLTEEKFCFPAIWWQLAHPPTLRMVIIHSLSTVIRTFFFIILFVKWLTICMCHCEDRPLHPAACNLQTKPPLLLSSLSVHSPLFVSSAITIASCLYYAQIRLGRTVLNWFFFYPPPPTTTKRDVVTLRGINFQFWRRMDFKSLNNDISEEPTPTSLSDQ